MVTLRFTPRFRHAVSRSTQKPLKLTVLGYAVARDTAASQPQSARITLA